MMAISETPPFWFEKPSLKSWLLWPVSALYNRASSANMLSKPSANVSVPVICVGNFVVGGGGKTPTVLSLAKFAKSKGYKPGILSRGYGGKISTATQVDIENHISKDVGDEPLLLARQATTVISVDRIAGAKLLVELGCTIILMDDGFQNPKLEKDYNLVVVDSKRGIGNGFTMPAGPLRVDIGSQFQKTDALLIIGDEGRADKAIRLAARAGKPIFHASSRMKNKELWKNKSVLPYAGIADPRKFFDSLTDAGAQIAQITSFADHHFYTKQDAKELLDKSKLMGAQLVTTAKDFVRLMGMGEFQNMLAQNSKIIEIEFLYEDQATLEIILQKALENFERRKLATMTGEV